jgi:hypothetical protein
VRSFQIRLEGGHALAHALARLSSGLEHVAPLQAAAVRFLLDRDARADVSPHDAREIPIVQVEHPAAGDCRGT